MGVAVAVGIDPLDVDDPTAGTDTVARPRRAARGLEPLRRRSLRLGAGWRATGVRGRSGWVVAATNARSRRDKRRE